MFSSALSRNATLGFVLLYYYLIMVFEEMDVLPDICSIKGLDEIFLTQPPSHEPPPKSKQTDKSKGIIKFTPEKLKTTVSTPCPSCMGVHSCSSFYTYYQNGDGKFLFHGKLQRKQN